MVLPEPCRPTSISGTGAGASRSSAFASEPSISTSSSWTILTTCWPGVTERITSWPTARALHLFDEGAHHFQRDVGLDQRAADLAHRLADVGLRQRAALGQPVEDAAEALLQGVEHCLSFTARFLADSRIVANAVRTRGRNALADADLRDQAPVGFSNSRLFSELAAVYVAPAASS